MKRLLLMITVILWMVFVTLCAYSTEEESKATIAPKKVSVDANYNGKPDRFEYYNSDGTIAKVEIDKDENGIIDETIIYEKGKPVKREKDTNQDGKADVWIDY